MDRLVTMVKELVMLAHRYAEAKEEAMRLTYDNHSYRNQVHELGCEVEDLRKQLEKTAAK